MAKSGYLFVYVSNASTSQPVYFDNLQVTHVRGPILEETHYYPFGLTMAAISCNALDFGNPANKRNKFQDQEFNEDLGIKGYEFKFRMHDPGIGRFWQIDPLADKYVYNSTYAFSENKVTSHIELEGLEAVLPEDKKGWATTIDDILPKKAPQSVPESNQTSTIKKAKEEPKGSALIGYTISSKATEEVDIINSGWGDKITYSTYTGKTSGKGGTVATVDFSTNITNNKAKADGISLSVPLFIGSINWGVSSDGISTGFGMFGAEIHTSFKPGNGSLFGVLVGGSYTNSKGEVNGGDISVKPGGVTVAAAAIYFTRGAIFPYLLPLF
jgi:RHS repeat-associated protein